MHLRLTLPFFLLASCAGPGADAHDTGALPAALLALHEASCRSIQVDAPRSELLREEPVSPQAAAVRRRDLTLEAWQVQVEPSWVEPSFAGPATAFFAPRPFPDPSTRDLEEYRRRFHALGSERDQAAAALLRVAGDRLQAEPSHREARGLRAVVTWLLLPKHGAHSWAYDSRVRVLAVDLGIALPAAPDCSSSDEGGSMACLLHSPASEGVLRSARQRVLDDADGLWTQDPADPWFTLIHALLSARCDLGGDTSSGVELPEVAACAPLADGITLSLRQGVTVDGLPVPVEDPAHPTDREAAELLEAIQRAATEAGTAQVNVLAPESIAPGLVHGLAQSLHRRGLRSSLVVRDASATRERPWARDIVVSYCAVAFNAETSSFGVEWTRSEPRQAPAGGTEEVGGGS